MLMIWMFEQDRDCVGNIALVWFIKTTLVKSFLNYSITLVFNNFACLS